MGVSLTYALLAMSVAGGGSSPWSWQTFQIAAGCDGAPWTVAPPGWTLRDVCAMRAFYEEFATLHDRKAALRFATTGGSKMDAYDSARKQFKSYVLSIGKKLKVVGRMQSALTASNFVLTRSIRNAQKGGKPKVSQDCLCHYSRAFLPWYTVQVPHLN